MKTGRLAGLAPDWLFGYSGVILIIGMFVLLITGFMEFTHSLTIPSMKDDLGISNTQAGLLLTVLGAVRMASCLLAGNLAARLESRYLVGIGTVGTGLSMLLLGYSPNYAVALAGMALMGLGFGFAMIPMIGLIAPWFEMQTRGMVAGLFSAGASLAFVVSGLVVPQLVDSSPDSGWRHTWFLFGVMALVVGAFALLLLRDRPRDPEATVTHLMASGPANPHESRGSWPLEVYKNPYVWLLTLMAFCSGAGGNVFNTFFGEFLEDKGESLATAGQLLLLIGILAGASSILWGRMSDRLGRGPAFGLSFLIQGLGFILLWVSPVIAAFVAASILLGITMRAAFTLCAAGSGDRVPVRFAAAAFGLISIGANLGSIVSPPLAGAVADAAGIGWVFAVALGASLIGVALSPLLRTPVQKATTGASSLTADAANAPVADNPPET